jgi:hypothetical protein
MQVHDALRALGLYQMPSSADEAKRAWRAAAMRAHPDRGGSSAAFVQVQAAMDAVIEAMASPVSGYVRSRHGAPLSDRLVLSGPVASPVVHQPLVDLRTWWREQAMLELGLAGLGNWTREGTLRGGVMPMRGKVRR